MKFSKRIRSNLVGAYRTYQLLFLTALVPLWGGTLYAINRSFRQYNELHTKLYVFHRDGASIQVVGHNKERMPLTARTPDLLGNSPASLPTQDGAKTVTTARSTR